jgi:plasmid stabilization system protein ParE
VTVVRLRPIAKRDLKEAAAWYRERNEEAAHRFMHEVSRTLDFLEQFPLSGGFVPGVDDAEIRQSPVRNFPYHVVFIRLPDRISALAIAHNRRQPGYWNA